MMARDFMLFVLLCVGCTEPLQIPKAPPPTQGAVTETGLAGASSKPKDGGADDAKTAMQADDDMAKDTDDDAKSSDDAGSEPVDAAVATDAGAMQDAAPDASADAASAPQAPDTIVGSWVGELRDPINRLINACVVVTQVGTPGSAGDAFYTGAFTCQTALSYLETVGDVHTFDEVVARGTVCPRGILALALNSDGTLKYDWYLNPGEIPEGVGMLDRVDRCP